MSYTSYDGKYRQWVVVALHFLFNSWPFYAVRRRMSGLMKMKKRPTRQQSAGTSPIDLESGDVVLLYDVHRGKSHHRHSRGEETRYKFVSEDALLADFLHDVNLILEGRL